MLTYQKLIDGVYLVESDEKISWKCNGLLISSDDERSHIAIDCNFPRRDLRKLMQRCNNNIEYYIVSHVHGDHINYLHNVERLGIPIYAPKPEHEYILEIEKFARANGSYDFNVEKEFKDLIFLFLRYKELRDVNGFKHGKVFQVGDKKITTIHSPGHSPAHTTFIIENGKSTDPKVLFTTDIGIEKLGPWLGFKYCSLEDYKTSILELEKIYLEGDYILTGGHCPVFYEKQPHIFQELLHKIQNTKNALLSQFGDGNPKGLTDITLKGLYYNVYTRN